MGKPRYKEHITDMTRSHAVLLRFMDLGTMLCFANLLR